MVNVPGVSAVSYRKKTKADPSLDLRMTIAGGFMISLLD
jgi:hypothetical protein